MVEKSSYLLKSYLYRYLMRHIFFDSIVRFKVCVNLTNNGFVHVNTSWALIFWRVREAPVGPDIQAHVPHGSWEGV